MPPADRAVLSQREEIIAALRQIVPGEGVITSPPIKFPSALAVPCN